MNYVLYGGQEYLFAYGRDITERKRAEETTQKQAALIDLSPDAIMVRRMDGTVTFWSRGAESLYGWTGQEALGQQSHALLRTQFPEPLAQIVEQVRQTGNWSGELIHFHKDGRQIIVQSRWQLKSADREGQGEILESNVDITERKRAEEALRELNATLETRVAERTAELTTANQEMEAFAYSVSHDLRAPLRHVTGFIELLEKRTGAGLDQEGQRYVRVISEAAQRMGRLIDDLLMLSRVGRVALVETDVDLGQVVEEVRQELAPETAGRVIEWQIGPLPRVRGDATLLRSVLANLLSNAIKYSRNRDPAHRNRQRDPERRSHLLT